MQRLTQTTISHAVIFHWLKYFIQKCISNTQNTHKLYFSYKIQITFVKFTKYIKCILNTYFNNLYFNYYTTLYVGQVKPLGVIWGKFPQWSRTNTVMVDDLRRNFIMNPENGLKVVLRIIIVHYSFIVTKSLRWSLFSVS